MISHRITKYCVTLFVSLFFSINAQAQVFSSKAKHAILIDVTSGATLYEKNAKERMEPASMSKMMTLAIVFEALKNGELALHDKMSVSINAWRKGGIKSGGSTMFLDPNPEVESPTVEDLIRGIAIQSGNDACIVIAEGMSGTEESFAERMTAFGKRIGMRDTVFKNSTGLPAEDQYTTANDLAILGRYLIEEYPDLYRIFSEPEFTWNKIRQFNRNPLLKGDIGGDGIKTGFTKKSGFGMVGAALEEDRRLLLVVNGLKTKRERSAEAIKLLRWGFRSFKSVSLFKKGEIIGNAKVFGGDRKSVELVARRNVAVLLPKRDIARISAKVFYKGPLEAPVEAGTPVGDLVIKVDGEQVQVQPVFASEDVATGTIQQRAYDALWELTGGWLGSKF